MKYIRIRSRELKNINPGYMLACPVCHAPAAHRCVYESGNRRATLHRERAKSTGTPAVLPDLSAWWREMRVYEGQNPKPRPEGLAVP